MRHVTGCFSIKLLKNVDSSLASLCCLSGFYLRGSAAKTWYGADQGIFKWLVSVILSTNLKSILCFTSAVTQLFLLAKLSCTAAQWVKPLSALHLCSTPLSSFLCVASEILSTLRVCGQLQTCRLARGSIHTTIESPRVYTRQPHSTQ